MQVVVLGTLGVSGARAPAPSGEVARRVLAVLAARANTPVPPDLLADLVWPGGERRGQNPLQAHISRWRKALGPQRITHSPAGYTLELGPGELDALEFEEFARTAQAARRTGDLHTALDHCARALSLWRGPAFGALADSDCVRSRQAELTATHAALRLARLELWCELGETDRVVLEAGALALDERWDEPLHRVLVLAHYRRGDQVTGLEVLSRLETALREDLGLDPTTDTRNLRQQMLRQEPALEARRAGAAPQRSDSGSVAERIDQLPEPGRQALAAAVLAADHQVPPDPLGSPVDTALLAAALDLDGPGAEGALAPVLATGFVVRSDGGFRLVVPDATEVAAGLVPVGTTLEWHRRLGVALLARSGGPEVRQRAARHLATAACMDPQVAASAVALDHQLAREALSEGRHADAVGYCRRARSSAGHLRGPDHDHRHDRAGLWLVQGEALQASGQLDAAMSAFRSAVQDPWATGDQVVLGALAHEECSLHARRPREGAHDVSVALLERAVSVTAAGAPDHVEVLAALAQALAFSGSPERAVRMAEEAVHEARTLGDPELMANTLLRALTVHDPVAAAQRRHELAEEAALTARSLGGAELELEALCAWVPEIMRVGDLAKVDSVVARVDRLAHVHSSALHRHKIPMWRAAVALAEGRWSEADVLVEDFRLAGERDGYPDTVRVHGFQSILLALGRGEPDEAAAILRRFEDDHAFEPWLATRLLVAHASGDVALVRNLMVPWSARRFTLSQPFAGVQTFCAVLVAEAVAEVGDLVARQRLGELVRPGLGLRQVLGAGAALLPDPAPVLARLVAGAPASVAHLGQQPEEHPKHRTDHEADHEAEEQAWSSS